MQKVKNLKIKCFRGVVETELPFNGKSVVLFGENGHGKSSFGDALEFFFKGKLPYLDEAKTTSTIRHVPHISHAREDCKVEINFLQGDITLSRTFNDPPQVPSQLENYYRLGSFTPFILRRKYLLDFVISQPAPRYTQLAALIGISELDNVELNLMRKRDEVDEIISSLEHKLREMQVQLNEKYGKEIESETQLIGLVNKRLKDYTKQTISSLEDIPRIKPKLVSETKSPEDIKKATKFKDASETAAYLLSKMDFLKNHKEFWSTINALQKDVKKLEEAAFQQLLEQGRNLIVEKNLDYCPLCLQPIQRDEIISLIERRLKDYEAINIQVDKIKQLRNALTNDLSEYIDNLAKFKNQMDEVDYTGDLAFINQVEEGLNSLKVAISPDPINIKLESLKKYQEACQVSTLLKDKASWLEKESKKYLGTKRDEEAVKIIDLLTATYETHNKITEISKDLEKKNEVKKQINSIYECFIKTNHEEVQRIYNELGENFCRYYEFLHPADEHRGIKLVIKRRASAEIKSKFFNREDEDPRGFYSEAHLDSLGLCIFLAFAKKFNVGFPLIVLDDIVSSIDAPHRNRIGELIFSEFPQHQFLITTHDDIWFEELCMAQQAFGVNNNFNNIRIIRWNLSDGPVLDKYKPRWEDINDKIKAGDKQGTANAGRRCLEWILFEMCINLLARPVLRRERRHEVKDLYEPFKQRITKLLPDFYEQNKGLFQKLESNGFFGNLLSHYNPDMGTISIDEVKDFIDSVKALYDLFYCETCSQFVQYHQSAKIIKCERGCKNWKTQ